MTIQQQVIESGGGVTYDWENDRISVKTTHDQADGRVTLVEDMLKPGFHLADHWHKKMTEIFYVLEGQVTFKFKNERIVASPGMTINVPPNVIHEVSCEKGARTITVFSPGGFDKYLQELASLSEAQLADEALMRNLSEQYDIWMA
ncbi:MAG: cupin domain-containing protein [Methylococcales bacterium]